MKKTKFIAVNAILFALILIFAVVPIAVGPVRIAALMLLPIIIAAVCEGYRTAFAASLFLGLVSLVTSYIAPNVLSFAFQNPVISVVARIFVGPLSCGAFCLCRKIRRKDESRISLLFSSAVAAAVAVVVNTGLVLGFLWAFYGNSTVGNTAITPEFFSSVFLVNFIIEFCVCVLLTPPLVMALSKTVGIYQRKKRKSFFSAQVEKKD